MRQSRGAALGAALLLLVAAQPVHAHGDPLPLSLWGDFGPAALGCQRALGSAALHCALTVLDARRACADAQLSGAVCDAAATDAAVAAARQRALDEVGASCSDVDATRLQFLGSAEALADLIRACREIEDALVSAAYGPALRDGDVAAVDARTRACLIDVAHSAARILRHAGRVQCGALDRVAAQPLAVAERGARLAHAGQRLVARNPAFATRLTARCGEDAFVGLYGRGSAEFAAGIAGRAQCIAGAVYVQGAVQCPPARCGNGMLEPGEACDDGNADDTDWCRSDCRRAVAG